MTYNVDDVFGVVRDVPLNYVPRESVDQALVDSLGRTKHIVIHGGSKQGKTCLRKHCLTDDDYVVVQCSNRWSLSDINTNILKRAGFEVTISTERATSGKQKILAKFSAKILGIGTEAQVDQEEIQHNKHQKAPLAIDPEDVNDLIDALNYINFFKFIVLEDFHYLGTDTQRDFAIELRACFKTCCACHSGVARWLGILMYSHVHCGLLAPSLGLAPSGPACGCSKSFRTILSRHRAPCSACARWGFKTRSKGFTRGF